MLLRRAFDALLPILKRFGLFWWNPSDATLLWWQFDVLISMFTLLLVLKLGMRTTVGLCQGGVVTQWHSMPPFSFDIIKAVFLRQRNLLCHDMQELFC
jgi:hypothetical protein